MASLSDLGINQTHAILAFIFAMAIVAVTALEVYFVKMDNTGLLFVVAQNIGIAIANSFYVSNVVLNPQGLSETTQTQTQKTS